MQGSYRSAEVLTGGASSRPILSPSVNGDEQQPSAGSMHGSTATGPSLLQIALVIVAGSATAVLGAALASYYFDVGSDGERQPVPTHDKHDLYSHAAVPFDSPRSEATRSYAIAPISQPLSLALCRIGDDAAGGQETALALASALVAQRISQDGPGYLTGPILEGDLKPYELGQAMPTASGGNALAMALGHPASPSKAPPCDLA